VGNKIFKTVLEPIFPKKIKKRSNFQFFFFFCFLYTGVGYQCFLKIEPVLTMLVLINLRTASYPLKFSQIGYYFFQIKKYIKNFKLLIFSFSWKLRNHMKLYKSNNNKITKNLFIRFSYFNNLELSKFERPNTNCTKPFEF